MKTKKAWLLAGLTSVILLSNTSRAHAEARTWTDIQNRPLSAEFIGLNGNIVHLKLANGNVAQVPIDRLKEPDQQLARALAAKMPAQTAALPAPQTWQQSVATIDRLVNAHLTAQGVKPNTPLTDEQFVRRVHLDIVGRIPNYDETMAFLNDKARDKRVKLIDTLLTTKGHFSHLYNYFGDMLRLKTKPNEYIGGGHYVAWIKDCIEKNVPYDEMARQMLTATGKSWETPAAGYLLRDAGMPLDNLALTLQVFAGLDIQCAQCHDHPFADWTQMEFYKMAAFFGHTATIVRDGEMRKKLFPKSNGNPTGRIEKELTAAGKYPEPDQLMRRMINTHTYQVTDNPTRLSLKLPHDYQYKDGKPGDVIEPKVLFGTMPDLTKFDSRRKAFADWLTVSSNDRFAAAIANRMWKRAFGRALVEPVIEVEDIGKGAVPGLLSFLATEMKRLKFDLRAFEKILYNTQAYQRVADQGQIEMGAPYHFPGPMLRRMTGEQIWDSFLSMILPDADYFYRKRDAHYQTWENALAKKSPDELSGNEAKELLSEAIRAIETRPGGIIGFPPGLKYEEGGNKLYADERAQGAMRYYGDVLIRASEYPQPNSGVLSQLGQGDRNLVDSATADGSVPVVLAFMNGPGTQRLTALGSRILETVDKFKADGPKVETVFLSVLNRMPSPEERSIAYKAIRRDGPDGFKNVVWALINTREFMFIQ
jgi:hypothetical protein